VERFLKWESDPERRLLTVAAALPRVVSEDVLGVLTSGRGLDDTERGQLFDWLRSLPFVTRDAGRCVYHDVVRTAMIRLERSQSPTRWRERHQALAEAYRQWRVTAFAEDAWDNAGWLSYRLEEIYHLRHEDRTAHGGARRGQSKNRGRWHRLKPISPGTCPDAALSHVTARSYQAVRRRRAMKMASVPWRWGQSWANRGVAAGVSGTSGR